MSLNRRHFIKLLGITVGSSVTFSLSRPAFAQLISVATTSQPYSLIDLPYAYDALEPYIDAETMHFHHDKHHAAYVNNLNAVVSKYPELQAKSVEELIKNLDDLPADIRTIVRNNGGGDLNHTMFWQIMSPQGGGQPSGKLGQAIIAKFGTFEQFQAAFNQAATKVFGSGWVWLVLNKSKELEIITTPNQDSPFLLGMYPIMGNDVWEHAYYLKYRNQRPEYLKQWWNVVNWKEINQRYLQAV
jgi:superoxide dismutase, Fe-Mn family